MISALPAHRVPAEQVHGNSMHPKVRAVLDRGLGKEWNYKELAELLGISTRAAQYLMNTGHLRVSGHPTKETGRSLRRSSGLSVLLYLITHSEEITEADAQPILKKVLPLCTDQILEGVIAACRALISKRSGMLVVVKPAQEARPKAPARETAKPLFIQAEFFPAPHAEPTANPNPSPTQTP